VAEAGVPRTLKATGDVDLWDCWQATMEHGLPNAIAFVEIVIHE
jgi:hypothetical protein